jgi:hypothetical protein
MVGDGRSFVQLLLIGERQQVVELLGIEAGQFEIEIRGIKLLQFEREEFLVPIGPGHRAIDHDAECLHLGRRPFIAQNDRHFSDVQFTGRL